MKKFFKALIISLILLLSLSTGSFAAESIYGEVPKDVDFFMDDEGAEWDTSFYGVDDYFKEYVQRKPIVFQRNSYMLDAAGFEHVRRLGLWLKRNKGFYSEVIIYGLAKGGKNDKEDFEMSLMRAKYVRDRLVKTRFKIDPTRVRIKALGPDWARGCRDINNKYLRKKFDISNPSEIFLDANDIKERDKECYERNNKVIIKIVDGRVKE